MSKEIGTLVVVVLKARHLRDKHTITKQDVYVQASLNKLMKQTATDVKGGQHPVWDEELRFPIVKTANDETRKLDVVIYSKEPRQDDLVGKGSVDISETLKTGEFDDWVQLFLEDGSARGDLFLEMTYYANTPPLQRRASKWVPSERLKRGPNGLAVAAAQKQNVLPPLPEDVVAIPGTASSPGIPSSLLPGGGGPKRASPKAGANVLPLEQPVHAYAPRDASPPAPIRNGRQSFDNVPAHLRPGGGAARPTHSPHSSITAVPEGQVARNSTFESVPPFLQPGGSASHHAHAPPESIPPYLQPGAGGPSALHHPPGRAPATSEPHIPTPEMPPYGAPSQPQPYSGNYSSSSYPPQSSYAGYPQRRSQSPPAHFVGGISSPPPQQQYPAYGSPPRTAYTPLAALPQEPSYPPYGAPPAPTYPAYGSPPRATHALQNHVPPQSYPPYGGYPAGRGSPAPGLNLPDPYLEKRYHSPLPLPDGSLGHPPTPAPSHPHSHSKPSIPVPQPTPAPVSATPVAAPPPAGKEAPKPKGPSRQERDRSLALELEKEEEERKRRLREQEERDMELARQLDLELNLATESGGGEGAAPAAGATAAAGNGQRNRLRYVV